VSRVRIKDIARLANVSTGTVDRVIHERPGVSGTTRERVQKIIQEYDYQPDILAGALASGRTYRILVCMPDVVSEHAFWRFPESGVERALSELTHFDFNVEYLRFDQHNKSDFLKKAASTDPSGYDGLLFAPVFSRDSTEFVMKFRNAGVPCVQFNSRIEGNAHDGFIGQDAYQSGYLGGKLMNYGLTPGHDVLVVNLSLRRDNYDHIIRRERGFRAYFEEHGDRIRNLVSVNVNGNGYRSVATQLSKRLSELDVTGIFVTNSRVHLVARYLAERGNMGTRLIGYDLLPESVGYLRREYIDFLISQSPEEQAYMGIRQLFTIVVLKKHVRSEVLLPIDILTRENIDHYLKYNAQYE